MKPRLFIASSTKGRRIAEVIQLELKNAARVTIWDQAFFRLSTTVLEAFEEQFEEFNFAVFVFLPEDTTKMRGNAYRTIRDNVILELGFAIGRLGRKRCFIVVPEKRNTGEYDIHLPTDIEGIMYATYDPPAARNRKLRDLQSALGPACAQIREAMQDAKDKDRPFPETSKFSPLEYGMLNIWHPIGGGAILSRISGARKIRIAKTWPPEDMTIAAGLKIALTKGTRIEVLMCEPDSEILKIRSEGAGQSPSRTASWIVDGVKLVHNAVARNRNLEFSIGFHKAWPGCPLMRAGKHIFLGFYFLGDSSLNWPWIEVRPNSKLARILDKQWDELWKQRTATLDTPRKFSAWLRKQERIQ